MSNLEEKRVVTCFLESDGKILLLQRSDSVSSYPGKWAGVSGYIEEIADAQALKEILEETRLFGSDIVLVRKGDPLMVDDDGIGVRWVVHPYLFYVVDRKRIKIDWEHSKIKWIKPKQISKYDTVPMLKEALERVYKI